jgi:hypothetical protein
MLKVSKFKNAELKPHIHCYAVPTNQTVPPDCTSVHVDPSSIKTATFLQSNPVFDRCPLATGFLATSPRTTHPIHPVSAHTHPSNHIQSICPSSTLRAQTMTRDEESIVPTSNPCSLSLVMSRHSHPRLRLRGHPLAPCLPCSYIVAPPKNVQRTATPSPHVALQAMPILGL